MKQPKLRFPEFTGDWKQHKFEDVVTIGSGKDYKHLESGNVPVYGTGGYMLSVNQALSESEDAVGIGRKGTIDKPYILRAPFWTVDTLFYCIPNEGFDLTFTNCLFQNVDWKKKDESTGVPSLSKVIINNVKTYVPSLEEQQKIAFLFTELDSLIQSAEKELEGYRELKQGMLQKMFPKKGEKVPEIRFPEFTGDWEQLKLSEVSDVRDGTHDSPSYQNEGHPFVTSKNVKDGYINYDDIQYISDEDFNNINKRSKVDINDILMGMIGTIGNLALIRTEPDFAIKNVALIKDTKQISYLYLYYYLQSPSTENQLLSGLDGGTQKFISLKKIRELNVSTPSESEQLKIGEYFQNLDSLIASQEQELDGYKELKKGLLQQMFC